MTWLMVSTSAVSVDQYAGPGGCLAVVPRRRVDDRQARLDLGDDGLLAAGQRASRRTRSRYRAASRQGNARAAGPRDAFAPVHRRNGRDDLRRWLRPRPRLDRHHGLQCAARIGGRRQGEGGRSLIMRKTRSKAGAPRRASPDQMAYEIHRGTVQTDPARSGDGDLRQGSRPPRTTSSDRNGGLVRRELVGWTKWGAAIRRLIRPRKNEGT